MLCSSKPTASMVEEIDFVEVGNVSCLHPITPRGKGGSLVVVKWMELPDVSKLRENVISSTAPSAFLREMEYLP